MDNSFFFIISYPYLERAELEQAIPELLWALQNRKSKESVREAIEETLLELANSGTVPFTLHVTGESPPYFVGPQLQVPEAIEAKITTLKPFTKVQFTYGDQRIREGMVALAKPWGFTLSCDEGFKSFRWDRIGLIGYTRRSPIFNYLFLYVTGGPGDWSFRVEQSASIQRSVRPTPLSKLRGFWK